MIQVIIKQLGIFPSVTKDQLYRLTKGYLGCISQNTFNLELNHLIRIGIAKKTMKFDSVSYCLTK